MRSSHRIHLPYPLINVCGYYLVQFHVLQLLLIIFAQQKFVLCKIYDEASTKTKLKLKPPFI
jgi:hypothetical protein